MPNLRIFLRKNRDFSLKQRHPWVFSGALENVDSAVSEGDVVDVFSQEKEFLCTGIFSYSSIAIKVLAFHKAEIDQKFLIERVQAAHKTRETLGLVDGKSTTAYRLINGEGDFLPGLIVDMYAETAVMQFHSYGMYRLRDEITAALVHVCGPRLKAVFQKSENTLQIPEAEKSLEHTLTGYLFGEKGEQIIHENGHRFLVDWEQGQKTGFYTDQRDNRSFFRQFVKDKRVLNAFSYTGAFSVYAIGAQAAETHSVDSSGPALQLLAENLKLNFQNPLHQSIESDCFEYLKHTTETYDVIVLDPPPFAKHSSAVDSALSGYRALNYHALRCLHPGGLLFTFSCSQLVSRQLFRESLRDALSQRGRRAQVLTEFGQSACHTIDAAHPEGSYLKGLLLRVD